MSTLRNMSVQEETSTIYGATIIGTGQFHTEWKVQDSLI